jgi:hypothetical protein
VKIKKLLETKIQKYIACLKNNNLLLKLHKIKEELKDEHQTLIEEKTRLLNLVEAANEVFNTYKVRNL